jgi:hypothetical protein
MRKKLFGMRLRAAAAIVLIAAGSAVAAAFADHTTVRLEEPPPVLIEQDTPWEATFELSRRGRDLNGYRPVIDIENADGKRTYSTTQTGLGTYRAHVVFPHLGPWTYRIRVGSETLKTGVMNVYAQ